jgi:tellurite resistance protein TehA-like permease
MTSAVREQVADLNPGYGAWVMATAIVSTGLEVFGRHGLSVALLVIGCAAFALLLVATGWRLARFRDRLLADAADAGLGFGYFSLVAAADVLGVRFALDHHPHVTLVLAAASVPLWLGLTYAIPGAIVMGHREGPVLPEVNGSWLLWVVATQSLSTSAATLALAFPDHAQALAPLAVGLWGVGVVLYLMLAAVVTLRLLEVPVTPEALSPTHWIYMGATAITVLGAARILQLPAALPVVAATHDVVSGMAFVLWAFGTWFVPLLLTFVLWRHAIQQEPTPYDPTWWSMVFPLGMYAVASEGYGRTTGMGFMVDIGRVELWLGVAAWLAVSAAMARSVVLSRGRGARPGAAAAGTRRA